MDIFQLIGDFLHLVAILLLLLKIVASKNVVGLSYKTQELFIVVFLTRYSDFVLEKRWGSMYFNVMRIIFIAINIMTIYYMRYKRPYKLVILSLLRAMTHKLTVSHTTTYTQVLWYWLLYYTRSGQYTVSSRPSRGGWKHSLYCRNCT